MKILAMYLPQFHKVKENDEWWGDGYTEWTAVKNAKPLFIGHNQPRIPLNERYYNLLERESLEFQTKLMKTYGIDGMCFYHYYFKNGKKILEKPVENLLKWTDIDMPFCFCWANESWVRTWSNVNSGAVWSSIYDNSSYTEGERGILLEQKYGIEEDWEQHFNYLLPFFEDSRYIKKNGCPVFVIYKPNHIHCLSEMKICWNKLAQRSGIESIYFIESSMTRLEKNYSNMMIYEPAHTIDSSFRNEKQNNFGIKKYISYDEFWNQLLLNTQKLKKGVCLSGVVGYDNTPRHGHNGMVLYDASCEKFQKYFSILLIRAYQLKSDFVFLNAWNEWAEGMYLEPDIQNNYTYLEAVLNAKRNYRDYLECKSYLEINTEFDAETSNEKTTELISDLKNENYRYKGYWTILNKWLELSLEGKSVGKYIKNLNYNKIAIYGLGMLGEHLLTDFIKNGVKVVYGIDRRNLKKGISIYQLQDDLPEADLVIVTVNTEYEIIRNQLGKKVKSRIISLESLLFEM